MKDKEREREGGKERERVKKKKSCWYIFPPGVVFQCVHIWFKIFCPPSTPTSQTRSLSQHEIVSHFYLCSLSTTERVRAWTYLNTDVNSCQTLIIHHKYVNLFKKIVHCLQLYWADRRVCAYWLRWDKALNKADRTIPFSPSQAHQSCGQEAWQPQVPKDERLSRVHCSLLIQPEESLLLTLLLLLLL